MNTLKQIVTFFRFKYLRISLLLVFIVQNIYGQDFTLSEAALKEDYKMAMDVISSLSPDLTAKDLEAIKDEVEKELKALDNASMNSLEFVKVLSNTSIDFKTDEHGNFTLPSNVLVKQLTTQRLFPVPLKIINNRLFVNTENENLPFGTEVTGINGLSTRDILISLTKGNLEDTYELRNIEANFDILYCLLIGGGEVYNVEYIVNNKKHTKALNGIELSQRGAIHSNQIFPLDATAQNNIINTEYLPKFDTYYFQLNSFEIESHVANNKAHYQEFEKRFDSVFKSIKEKKPKHLIIDIRHNRGGDAFIPPLLYSYIAKKNFTERVALKMKTFDLPHREHLVSIGSVTNKDEFVSYLSKLKNTFTKSSEGLYLNILRDTIVEPKTNAYKGKVHLLVGGNTVSAGAYFTALFKSEERGMIYGEKTGGSHRDMTAGQMAVYELPNSKIKVSIPLMKIDFSKRIKQRLTEKYIMPDKPINQKDAVLEFKDKKDFFLTQVLKYI
ncbi:S41 family peptidase [Winogradskyella sp. 3972H.M.0a.05]|uniref:S41 family peptidase n=1 Tax=Winogradskyella sp. 3972H.M.0a.05 TaxID=2950277 RepID=UPI003394C123